MIGSFKSKALKRFWTKGEARHLPDEHIDKITQILDLLDAAVTPEEMNIPGLCFHGLSGKSKRRYAVKVSANYRITFAFEGPDTIDINYEDYH